MLYQLSYASDVAYVWALPPTCQGTLVRFFAFAGTCTVAWTVACTVA